MNRLFRPYAWSSAVSNVGDWMRILVLNWVVVDALDGTSVDNMLRVMLGGVASVLGGFIPLPRFRVGFVIGVASLYAGLSSAVLAVLLFTGHLSISATLLLDTVAAFLWGCASPHGSAFLKLLSGNQETEAAIELRRKGWGARFVAGAIIVLIAFAPSAGLSTVQCSLLLMLDALSFLPIVMVTCYAEVSGAMKGEGPAGAELEELLKPKGDALKGLRYMLEQPAGKLFLLLLFLHIFVGGTTFVATPEILRARGAALGALSIWLLVTGVASYCAVCLGLPLLKRTQIPIQRLYFIAFVVSGVIASLLGMTGSAAVYIVVYCALSANGAIIDAWQSAYFNHINNGDNPNVGRLRFVVERFTWIVRFGWFALLAKFAVTLDGRIFATGCLVLFIALASLVLARRSWQRINLPQE